MCKKFLRVTSFDDVIRHGSFDQNNKIRPVQRKESMFGNVVKNSLHNAPENRYNLGKGYIFRI